MGSNNSPDGAAGTSNNGAVWSDIDLWWTACYKSEHFWAFLGSAARNVYINDVTDVYSANTRNIQTTRLPVAARTTATSADAHTVRRRAYAYVSAYIYGRHTGTSSAQREPAEAGTKEI